MAAPALGGEANKTETKPTCSCLDFCAAPGRPLEIPTAAKNSGCSGWGPQEGFSTSAPRCRADPLGD